MRRFGLVLIALAMLAAPVGAASHAAAPEGAVHAHAATVDHDGTASAPCDAADDRGVTPEDSVRDCIDCCLPSCHVVSAPLMVPIGGALAALSPSAARLAPADSRLPGGLDLQPLLGPPRSDA